MTMEINGFYAELHNPEKLEGQHVHGLPPYSKCEEYIVDDFPACPDNWMHGSSLAQSYFCPVLPRGMWFNFTRNASHSHDVAVVTSVQGVNPITGPMSDGKPAELRMEQYRHKCPKHDTEFRSNRFCEQCNFEWPAQNYLSTTSGVHLWIDGFRTEKGETRQYVITKDCSLGVAAQMLGDKRVWAIGFAFYKSKTPKPEPKYEPIKYHPMIQYGSLTPVWKKTSYTPTIWHGVTPPPDVFYSMGSPDLEIAGCDSGASMSFCPDSTPVQSKGILRAQSASLNAAPRSMQRSEPVVTVNALAAQEQLEIAAGARIRQDIGVDPQELSYWEAEPSGMIYVNYVSTKVAEAILEKGQRANTDGGAFHGIKLAN